MTGKVFALGLIVGLCGQAPAQEFVVYQDAFGASPALLWQRPDVQADLHLTAAQLAGLVKALAPVQERYEQRREQLARLQKADAEAAGRAYSKLRQETQERATAAIAKVLTAEQQKRLGQIALQLREAEAFLDPEVQRGLGLSAAQKKKVQALADEYYRDMARLRRQAGGVFAKGELPAAESPLFLRRQLLARTRLVLTPDQRRTWEGMIGEPFPRPPARK